MIWNLIVHLAPTMQSQGPEPGLLKYEFRPVSLSFLPRRKQRTNQTAWECMLQRPPLPVLPPDHLYCKHFRYTHLCLLRLSFLTVPHVAQAGPHSVPSLWPPGAEITSLPVTPEGKNKATQCAWTHAWRLIQSGQSVWVWETNSWVPPFSLHRSLPQRSAPQEAPKQQDLSQPQ